MTTLSVLEQWSDDRGNRVLYEGCVDSGITLVFTGRGNTLTVDPGAQIASLAVQFDADNGAAHIGPSSKVPALRATLRVGQDSTITLGRNVSTTSRLGMSAVEGTTITVGDDVMFASENQVRTDDGHPIFDVRTGKRVNTSRDITIGNHVWVGWGAVLLGGTTVGEGSVVGMNALAKGAFPNNCVVAGVPASVVRRDVAWERPHLSMAKPYYKPDAGSVTKSAYWALTEVEVVPPTKTKAALTAVRRPLGRIRRRVRALRQAG